MTPSIEIEKGVSVPLRRHGRGGGRPRKYPFDRLAVGDSFMVKPREGWSSGHLQMVIDSCARGFRRCHEPSRKFTVRQVDGGVRCWRIA